ncbi:hypothetical protein QLL95_gp0110 [Cotonvirus japonicus]|uniref:Uncharacterized protein n=1 Tax=Cotonvirus japonicus TaxID=2811091 RepID=A0ABM7NR16_9VIRU|nr:hypothetical protein QLL95_gp0110 [Cotonvirus japonicus]BCS82599.1 hypothetical protein [Cotonvirus japonicus]
MENQMIFDQCDCPNYEPTITRSSKFNVYDGMFHRIGNNIPAIIQSSTPNTWYTNNSGAIVIDVSHIGSKN